MLAKSESLQLKGSAILIMVLLHLFNRQENVDQCIISVNLLGEPLVSQLAKFVEICVPLYLFLSGYGLYLQFQKNGIIFPVKRILKLYLIFWTCFVVFIPLGCILVPQSYPGDWITLIENITAWKTSYNWEWWFIFPYLLLLFVSNILFKCIAHWNFFTSFLFSCMVYVISYLVISLYKSQLVEFYALYNFFEFLRMLCSFMWGALFVKYDIFAKIKSVVNQNLNILWTNVLMICILVGAFFVRAIMSIHAASVLFMIVFACCFCMLKKNSLVENFLKLMGEHSTNIWLVHTFFCYYYFHDFIYGLKYPVLIYSVTLGFSFISSIILNKIHFLLLGKMNQYILKINK